jgi:hypothetical protein
MELTSWKFWLSVIVIVLVTMYILNRPFAAKVKTAIA